MKKNNFIVGIYKTGKILGYNLSEEEKDNLFYNIQLGNARSIDGERFYTTSPRKMKDKKEVNLLLSLRKSFKNNRSYSYIILDEDNNWLTTGYGEDEEEILDTIQEIKEEHPDKEIYVFEINRKHLTV